MKRFRDLPIRVKLRRLTMLSSTVAIAIAGLAIVIFQWITFRAQVERESLTLAREIGYYSAAALVFRDAEDAHHALSGLKHRPFIAAATLYDQDGEVLTQYLRNNSRLDAGLINPPPEPDGIRFQQGYVSVFHGVLQEGKTIGILYLLSDIKSLYPVMVKYLLILLLVMLGSLLTAWWISSKMQGQISGPLLKLSAASEKITRDKDYAIRVDAESADESGMLTRAFNTMLQEIHQRDQDLLAARDQLERRVEERTAELQEANEELEHSLKDLEQFAAIASHDLQEPLRMIGSYLQLLEKKYHGQLDAEADEYIDYAVSGAIRLQSLINDLLTFSRIGMRGQQNERVDMNGLMTDIEADLKSRIEEAGAEITWNTLPTIVADRRQVEHLLRNLVSNGIKFRGAAPPRIHVDCTRKGDAHLFSIQDNGIGIEEAYQERVFKIFQRLHSDKKIPGTGIGLAICQKVVERHRGAIWMVSKPGDGTTVYFSMPPQSPPESSGRPEESD